MNRRITLMTSEESFHNNYGAALQGYALYRTLEECGYAPTIIRYRGGVIVHSFAAYCVRRVKMNLRVMYNAFFPNDKMKADNSIRKTYAKPIRAREKLFRDFQKDHLSFWNSNRVSWYELQKKYPVCDVYVCGSDQIWNPYFKSGNNDPGYFLAFAPKGSKKIAYAPSFGADDIPPSAQTNLRQLLADFHAISVREKSGVDIVRKYAGREAQWVLDPTLLRTPEQWKAIARMPENLPDKYILCYRFADSQHTAEMIQKTSEALSLPVVSMPLSDVALKDPFQFIFEVGPREFIGLIQNASLVCTDSFHATVFSILMKTPVAVFEREAYSNGGSMNSRIESLMDMLTLNHLIIRSDDLVPRIVECMNEDYIDAHEKLLAYRQESLEFLKEALREE